MSRIFRVPLSSDPDPAANRAGRGGRSATSRTRGLHKSVQQPDSRRMGRMDGDHHSDCAVRLAARAIPAARSQVAGIPRARLPPPSPVAGITSVVAQVGTTRGISSACFVRAPLGNPITGLVAYSSPSGEKGSGVARPARHRSASLLRGQILPCAAAPMGRIRLTAGAKSPGVTILFRATLVETRAGRRTRCQPRKPPES